MKIQEMRELTRAELIQRKNDLEDERFSLCMRKSFKALDNPLRLRHIRRETAWLLTVLREDKLGLRKLAQSKTSILDEAQSARKKEK